MVRPLFVCKGGWADLGFWGMGGEIARYTFTGREAFMFASYGIFYKCCSHIYIRGEGERGEDGYVLVGLRVGEERRC